ncbi:TasA family protein [Cellulosimicrobium sp. Marseille-Q4280]|uniref:TasA family protein n=1 Tax=Cellulosimicrobium sp. Marseille-Q4280 TaxID=2937992 RepID=UPI00203E5E67|nr:TasA family protein [Cellulosimicrobium sp. Marseille-Q4280]
MTVPHRRRRAVAVLAVTALAATLATGAAFVETEVVDGNAFTSGVLDLTISPAEHRFEVAGMAPGDTVTEQIGVTNSGTVDLHYTVTVARDEDSGPLAEVLTTRLDAEDGQPLVTSAGLPAAAPAVNGTTVRTLGAGDSETLTATVALPRETGNGHIGTTANLTWAFNAAQVSPGTPVALPDPRGAWDLEEGRGMVVADSSGRGLDATVTGTIDWIAGVDGGAVRFDGHTSSAGVPHTPELDVRDAVSVAAWVRPELIRTQNIVKKSENGLADGYELSISSSGKPFFRINQWTNGDTYRVNGPDVLPVDAQTWVHLAGTYDGQTMRLFIDGVEVASVDGPTHVGANVLPLTIASAPSGEYRFQGGVDQVRVYASALSPEQVAALYASARP